MNNTLFSVLLPLWPYLVKALLFIFGLKFLFKYGRVVFRVFFPRRGIKG